MSLFDAFVVHFLSAVAIILLVSVLIGIAEVPGAVGITGAVWGLMTVLGGITEEFARYPWQVGLTTAAIGASIELGFVALALVITPWGAQDEPIRSSFANALRRTWLHTTHALVAVLLVGTLGTTLSRMETAWDSTYPIPAPEWPERPPEDLPRDSQAWKDYQKDRQRLWEQHRKWMKELESKQPWYFRHLEIIIIDASVLSAIWLAWALLRAVGAPRRTPPIPRPPTCEACGYNLTTIPMESRCPECGEPVMHSLGPNTRCGTPWQRRTEVGRLAAWWRCCVDSISRPRQFGRQVRVVSLGTDHRRFLVTHLPIVFILTAVGVILLFVVDTGQNPFAEEPIVAFVVCPLLGTMVTLATLGLTMLAAGVVGLWYVIQDKRNLLAGSMQIASYLAGYLTLWIAFAWATGAIVMAMNEAGLFHIMENVSGIDDDLLAFFAWLIPNLVCAVAYFDLVARGTAGLRYANR